MPTIDHLDGGERGFQYESTSDMERSGGSAQGHGNREECGHGWWLDEYTSGEGLGRGQIVNFFSEPLPNLFTLKRTL